MKKIALSFFGVLFLLAFVACKKDKPAAETVTDIDGNVYKTVKIGTQTWMAENLKTTRFNDGTQINYKPQTTPWINENVHGYCWYNNDLANYNSPYGALYNGFTVKNPKLAPKGWHIPTKQEWEMLIAFCNNDAAKIMQNGNEFWLAGNTATNTTGFGAVAAGYRSGYSGSFLEIKNQCRFWTSTIDPVSQEVSYALQIYSDGSKLIDPNSEYHGLSVRCIKD